MTQVPLDRSYRALFAVPSLGRVLLGMQIARIAQTMVSVAIVLFTLTAYGSPALAGLVTFASLFPGLLVSPVAGALLDRHGRARLIVLDYLVALAALILIGVLALTGHLPPWLLVLIAAVSSLTGILSHTGLRSLFPIIVPSHLWERVNAVDSNGYVVATIIGPPLAAGLVAVIGGPVLPGRSAHEPWDLRRRPEPPPGSRHGRDHRPVGRHHRAVLRTRPAADDPPGGRRPDAARDGRSNGVTGARHDASP